MLNNTYEARLERLKEELNRPSVTEMIQMHKLQLKNQTDDKVKNLTVTAGETQPTTDDDDDDVETDDDQLSPHRYIESDTDRYFT